MVLPNDIYGFECLNSLSIILGLRLGIETSHLAGDSWMQGGTVLLDQDGRILFQV